LAEPSLQFLTKLEKTLLPSL